MAMEQRPDTAPAAISQHPQPADMPFDVLQRPQTAAVGEIVSPRHFSLEGEATPERLTADPVKLRKLHEDLRNQLMDSIRSENHPQIISLLSRGATLLPHYYSARLPGKPGTQLDATPKGPKAGLVNPVEWAILEGRFTEAKLLLELANGKVVFGRDEQQSSLKVLSLAQQCQHAVVITCMKEQLELLRMLLERGADVTQRNQQGETALHVSVRASKKEAVEVLLQFGAWGAEPNKQEVLHHAEAQRMLSVLSTAGVLADPMQDDLIKNGRPDWNDMFRDMAASPIEGDKAYVESRFRDAVSLRHQCRPISPRPSSPQTRCQSRHGTWEEPPLVSLGPVETLAELKSNHSHLQAELVRDIRKGDSARVVGIVRRGARLDLEFNLGYGEAGNCIDWACVSEQPGVALKLFELADEQNLGTMLAVESTMAVYWSVVHGYLEVLQSLLARGADVGKRGAPGQFGFGASALTLAVSSWRPAEAQLLLEHGALEYEPEAQRAELLKLVRDRGREMAEVFRRAGIEV
eukprot:TRINITY_DN112425_c0_g1_i1.p1 TRINITY_DN112425_c0_g1~~TRINITY_DN112425_c0_g1_i1.p1  ORF type:complete len:521 (-),score=106.61 TRINITY_DN112425_c0_g1_i1:73-1635(-)